MCGIAGIFNPKASGAVVLDSLKRMISLLHHRGPDGYGFYTHEQIGLAHARLSVIDLEGGWQPIHNEDKSLWVIFNGEIFNYKELRAELEERGHHFYTHSDTEVIVHLFEEKGPDCLTSLNGQFAIAIYNQTDNSLFLARDRMGIRPLFYTFHRGTFYFASEIKSIFAADTAIPRAINPEVLSEIFTFWAPGGDETVFSGVKQLPPGHWMIVNRDGAVKQQEYWDIPFGATPETDALSEEGYSAKLRDLLIDAVRLQLRADVPVGAYLSGGLDSSAITTLVRNYTNNPLKTFSVTFSDKVYDESAEQNLMIQYLKTDHHSVQCSYRDVADHFEEVIWHTEIPILRTAPTPLFILSELVRQNGYKVVLTGEGSDEVLGGYDIFKEAKIRAFIHRQPDSDIRPFLLKRLYPYLALSPTKSAEYAKKFFKTDADWSEDLFYAHRPRWQTTERTKLFFSEDLHRAAQGDIIDKLAARYRSKLVGLDLFSRAQYLESHLLLGNYLLSSQGDRMGMGHSIEGRFPFLDHNVVEFACTIPPHLRMKVLNEKNILKKAMQGLLPEKIISRKKQPYMAPDILSFFGDDSPEYLKYYLSESMLTEAGFFKPQAVKQLVQKCGKNSRQGFRENMAFIGILSTQILYDKFIKNFAPVIPGQLENIKVVS
jgi:asparagine synthase (glutamine-hydrolysing)